MLVKGSNRKLIKGRNRKMHVHAMDFEAQNI